MKRKSENELNKSIVYLSSCHLKRSNVLRLYEPRNITVLEKLLEFLQQHLIVSISIQCESDALLNEIFNQLLKYKDLTDFELRSWGMLKKQTILALKKVISNNNQIKSLDIRCGAVPDIIKTILPCLQNHIHHLDVSGNMILDIDGTINEFDKLFKRTSLKKLCLKDSPTILGSKLYNCLSELGFYLSLNVVEGIDLSKGIDLPDQIRQESLSKPIPLRNNEHILEYLKNKTFSKILSGCHVRVWWPPTIDPIKQDFSGRYWPAKILTVDPIGLSCVVKYENSEIEQVDTCMIQPLSPFPYRKFNNEDISDTDFCCLSDCSPFPKESLTKHIVTPPIRRRSQRQLTSTVSNDNKGNHFILNEFNKQCLKSLPNVSAIRLYEHTHFKLPKDTVGIVLCPGELCEFREPTVEQTIIDSNDFLAMIDSVKEEEPIYVIRYIFHDDIRTIRVTSYDVRRAIVFPWSIWRHQVFYHFSNQHKTEQNDPHFQLGLYFSPLTVPLNSSIHHSWTSPNDLLQLTPDNFSHWFRSPSNSHLLKAHPVLFNQHVSSQLITLHRKVILLTPYYEEALLLRGTSDRLKGKLSNIKTNLSCSICLDQTLDTLLLPCRHLNCCYECGTKIQKCPLCRSLIHKRIRISSDFEAIKNMLEDALDPI